MYRLVDHTADLAIEAEGDSRDEVLGEAALALTQVLTGRAHVHTAARPDRETTFHIDAPDGSALVVAFLSELLWLNESQDLLWLGGGVQVRDLDEGGLRLEARGNAAKHDAAQHGRGVEVKAVTYHGLKFGRGGDGKWHLWVLLDI